MSQPTCPCGRGKQSAYDGKCGHCRTKKEQKAHWSSKPKLAILVVNKHHGCTGEYIGRGSPLGNPWPITDSDPRDAVIDRYKIWLIQQIQQKNQRVINELDRLAQLALQGPVHLQCFCAPRRCHGDVIKQVITEAIQDAYPQYK